MDLSLSEAERARLAGLGVTPDDSGILRAASGREVSAGVAVSLLAKDADTSGGPLPAAFRRHYIAAGHAAESPHNTGRRGVTAVPETASEAEPEDFHRGYLREGHATPSPGNRTANNSAPPAAPAAEVYTRAAHDYAANQSRAMITPRLLPGQPVMSQPAPARVTMPADMRAQSVPAAVQVAASRPAPGETR